MRLLWKPVFETLISAIKDTSRLSNTRYHTTSALEIEKDILKRANDKINAPYISHLFCATLFWSTRLKTSFTSNSACCVVSVI